MNLWVGDGRLVRDPELKVGNSGSEYCKFTIANDRKHKDENGKTITDFIDCVAFGKTAAFIDKYFHKGDGANIMGRFESERYTDKDGKNRTSWGLTVEQISFPLGKGKSDRSAETPSVPTPAVPNAEPSDDDLPF